MRVLNVYAPGELTYNGVTRGLMYGEGEFHQYVDGCFPTSIKVKGIKTYEKDGAERCDWWVCSSSGVRVGDGFLIGVLLLTCELRWYPAVEAVEE